MDLPIESPRVTPFDHRHVKEYIRILDATAENADWREVAAIVLELDVVREPVRSRQVYEAYLGRARWMTEHGYRDLLKSAKA